MQLQFRLSQLMQLLCSVETDYNRHLMALDLQNIIDAGNNSDRKMFIINSNRKKYLCQTYLPVSVVLKLVCTVLSK